MMADITPLGLLTVRVYADDLGRGLVDLGKILIAAGRTPRAGPRGPSSQWTLSWSKGDSNSWSHPERQRSEGASHRPPFDSLDRVGTRLDAGVRRIRTCPVTASVLRLPQACGDHHSAAECLSSC